MQYLYYTVCKWAGTDIENDDCDGSDDESSSYDNDMSEEEEDSDDSSEGMSDVNERDNVNSTCSDE